MPKHTPFRTWTTRDPDGGLRTFAVRHLPEGAHIVQGTATVQQPTVEIFDVTYADDSNATRPRSGGFGLLGQFITRYNVDTFLAHEGGMDLNGGTPAWTLNQDVMIAIKRWLTSEELTRAV